MLADDGIPELKNLTGTNCKNAPIRTQRHTGNSIHTSCKEECLLKRNRIIDPDADSARYRQKPVIRRILNFMDSTFTETCDGTLREFPLCIVLGEGAG